MADSLPLERKDQLAAMGTRRSIFALSRCSVISGWRGQNGSLRSLVARLSRIDVLVIDDWTMAPLSEPARRDFREICDDRYEVRSTILTL